MARPGPWVLAGHLGRGPGLVDEHQALGLEVELPLEHDAPANTARTTRSRRSTDSALGMPAGLPTGRQLESHS